LIAKVPWSLQKQGITMREGPFNQRRCDGKRPPILLGVPDIAQTDDGTFELYLDGPSYPSRAFAESVRLQRTRPLAQWARQ
jgi:hypothetical protein